MISHLLLHSIQEYFFDITFTRIESPSDEHFVVFDQKITTIYRRQSELRQHTNYATWKYRDSVAAALARPLGADPDDP